jgi:hypothetical protein
MQGGKYKPEERQETILFYKIRSPENIAGTLIIRRKSL